MFHVGNFLFIERTSYSIFDSKRNEVMWVMIVYWIFYNHFFVIIIIIEFFVSTLLDEKSILKNHVAPL